MAAPTKIKWTDPGAPALTRSAGSLIGVLDYCLPQRGWEKIWHVNDKAVFRAGTGERRFYRVMNDGSFYYSNTAYQYCHARITAYESMSDIDTGAGQWSENYILLSYPGTAVPRPWVCIFDEEGFWLITIPDMTTGGDFNLRACSPHYFGETVPGLPGNTPRNVAAGAPLAMTTGQVTTLAAPSGNVLRCDRSLDGTRKAIASWLVANGGVPFVDNAEPYGHWTNSFYGYPYNGELLYGRPMLNDAVDKSMGDYIPGLYYPLHKGNGFNNLQAYQADGKSFMALYTIRNNYGINTSSSATPTVFGAALIDLSGEFRI